APSHITAISAKRAVHKTGGEVAQQRTDLLAGYPCVVCGWDKQLMLVDHVEIVNENEVVVPSRIRMELLQREPDIFGGPVYLSVIEGALDVLRRAGLGYGELNPLSVPVSENVRGDELPDSMVQCGPEVVNGIADDKREFG